MPKLLAKMRNAIKVRQYSIATEKVYTQWVRRFILFHGKKHPDMMGKEEVEAFLTYLAVQRGVSPSTQNQALQAILFLYRDVLNQELPWLDDVVRAKPKRRVPVVLNQVEVMKLLDQIRGDLNLPASLLYGSGLRAMECLSLRVGDLDLSRRTVRIHAGKGGKDRVTVLPDRVLDQVGAQIDLVRSMTFTRVMVKQNCHRRYNKSQGNPAAAQGLATGSLIHEANSRLGRLIHNVWSDGGLLPAISDTQT